MDRGKKLFPWNWCEVNFPYAGPRDENPSSSMCHTLPPLQQCRQPAFAISPAGLSPHADGGGEGWLSWTTPSATPRRISIPHVSRFLRRSSRRWRSRLKQVRLKEKSQQVVKDVSCSTGWQPPPPPPQLVLLPPRRLVPSTALLQATPMFSVESSLKCLKEAGYCRNCQYLRQFLKVDWNAWRRMVL